MSKAEDITLEIIRLRKERTNFIELERKRKIENRQVHLSNTVSKASDYIYGLYKQRKTLHVTQQQLADKIGLSRGAISNIDLGKNNPSLEVFLKINDVLKYYEINKLLKDKDDR